MIVADASTFQTEAIAWLGAISAVLLSVTGVVVVLVPKVFAMLESVRNAQDRLTDHSRRITNVNDKLTDIALEVPSNRTSRPPETI